MMKGLLRIFLTMTVAATAYAGGRATPEDLAAQFIAIVNAKNSQTQKAIIHPRCFLDLSKVERQFLGETLARDFRRTIPKKRTAKVSKLDEDRPLSGKMVIWPARPTHQFEIEFKTGENSSTSIIRFIAKDKGQWFIVVPKLNADNLKRYEEKRKSRAVSPPDRQ